MLSSPKRIGDSSFLLLANGASYAPPASGLQEYLLAHGARRVTAVRHPLTAEDGTVHEMITYERGRERRTHIRSICSYRCSRRVSMRGLRSTTSCALADCSSAASGAPAWSPTGLWTSCPTALEKAPP
jgi:hypothetical protein